MSELTFKELAQLAANPSRAISLILNRITDAHTGERLKFESSSHPFIRAIDTITAESYGLINRLSDAESRIYPKHARNTNDLFRHMSDYEFYGLFGHPSNATMRYAIPMMEIKRLAVPYEVQEQQSLVKYRKLTIPKDTMIEVFGLPFSVIHAIELRLMEGGYVQVAYDTKQHHPYFALKSNVLERRTAFINNEEYLYIDIPVKQLQGETKRKIGVTPSAGLRDVYHFEDKLFGVRAFLTPTGNNVTREISISYNNQVFNQDEVTLTIDVDQDNGTFTYAMPEVYVNNGRGVGVLTLIVYTTKGAYEQDLQTLRGHNHQVTYLDFDYEKNKLDKYSSPIRQVNNSAWEIISPVSGGANPRGFNELKQTFINNAFRQNIPISDIQLSAYLNAFGYSSTKLIDVYTKRLFKLTKSLPTTLGNEGLRSVNAYISKVVYSMNELRETGMVYDNYTQVTLPPNTVFSVRDNKVTILPKNLIDQINNMRLDERQDYVNQNLLVFSPFHQVLDALNGSPSLRPYLLDQPKYDNQNFLYENDSLGIELGVEGLSVSHYEDGYRILMTTRSDDVYKAMSDERVGAQLYLYPGNSKEPACLKGKVIGKDEDGNRLWEFFLKSNFEVDAKNLLGMTNMNMFNRPSPSVKVELRSDVRVLFLIESGSSQRNSQQDLLIDRTLFNSDMTCLIEVGYDIIFGKPLDRLYHRVYPVLGETQYERYPEDVPETYTKDEFKKENGELVFEDGELVLEHRAGEVMLQPDGSPVIRHHKNSLVRDSEGNLVLKEPKDLQFHMDFVCLDAKYLFSNDEYDQRYLRTVKTFVTDTVMQDMNNFQSQMRDKTELLFAPNIRLGDIDVIINSQYQTKIRADLSFSVVFYLNEGGIRSDTIRSALRGLTSEVINTELKKQTVSNAQLLEALKKVCPTEVVDIKINSFSEDTEIDVVSTVNQGENFSVRKRLESTGAGISSVRESISFSFLPHYQPKI